MVTASFAALRGPSALLTLQVRDLRKITAPHPRPSPPQPALQQPLLQSCLRKLISWRLSAMRSQPPPGTWSGERQLLSSLGGTRRRDLLPTGLFGEIWCRCTDRGNCSHRLPGREEEGAQPHLVVSIQEGGNGQLASVCFHARPRMLPRSQRGLVGCVGLSTTKSPGPHRAVTDVCIPPLL